ncbi:MAG: PHP domain-containing protein, partial [Blastocatellia bacterium]
PVLSGYFSQALVKYRAAHGRDLDFSRAYWTPPVTPRQVIDVETLQIEKELGLPALVSITDHDDIEAGLLLQVLDTPKQYPISMEWTVPFGGGYFHLGLHNLPRENAVELAAELAKYTNQSADSRTLTELLEVLNESPSTLIVLNHPFWDIELIGGDDHLNCLRSFIASHRDQLHALEINGFRTWKENQQTIQLADELGLPLVSGGDRHGCQPNSILNLTRARSFDDLVGEIREDGHSDIVIMPGYRESIVTRLFESVAEVIGNYPGHALGRSRWSDRIYIDLDGTESLPLGTHWPNGGPGWVRLSLWLLRRLGSKQLKPALRLALGSERVNFEYER